MKLLHEVERFRTSGHEIATFMWFYKNLVHICNKKVVNGLVISGTYMYQNVSIDWYKYVLIFYTFPHQCRYNLNMCSLFIGRVIFLQMKEKNPVDKDVIIKGLFENPNDMSLTENLSYTFKVKEVIPAERCQL